MERERGVYGIYWEKKIKLVDLKWRERERGVFMASIETRSLCQVMGYLGDRAGSTDICQKTEIKQKVMWERLQLSCGLKWCNCCWHSSHSLVPGPHIAWSPVCFLVSCPTLITHSKIHRKVISLFDAQYQLCNYVQQYFQLQNITTGICIDSWLGRRYCIAVGLRSSFKLF